MKASSHIMIHKTNQIIIISYLTQPDRINLLVALDTAY